MIKVTPEDGRFSDDDEGGGGDDSNKQSKQHQQQQQQPKMADRSKSPLDFQEPSTKAVQQQNINVNQSVEEKYRELVKQIEQYENKIDNFTGLKKLILNFYKLKNRGPVKPALST